MVGVDCHGFLFRSDYDSTSGQVVGFSEQPSGALMDGGNGCFIKDSVFDPCDGKVVFEILLHLFTGYAFEVTASHDS